MKEKLILDLMGLLKECLKVLRPVLIYYYQEDVRKHWRFVSNLRGPKWHPVLRTEEGLEKAANDWEKNQDFIYESTLKRLFFQ